MNKENIINYIRNNKTVTVPMLQKQFGLGYNQAKSVVDELAAKNRLVLDSGIAYKYKEEKPKTSSGATNNRAPNRYRTLSEYFAMVQNHEDDDDDDDVEEEIKPVTEQDKKENASGSRPAYNNFYELFRLKKVFNDCISSGVQSKSLGNAGFYALNLDNERYFKLKIEKELFVITDAGLTLSADGVNTPRAFEIIKEYKNMSYELGEIKVAVNNNTEALSALLDLYAATDRIKRGE